MSLCVPGRDQTCDEWHQWSRERELSPGPICIGSERIIRLDLTASVLRGGPPSLCSSLLDPGVTALMRGYSFRPGTMSLPRSSYRLPINHQFSAERGGSQGDDGLSCPRPSSPCRSIIRPSTPLLLPALQNLLILTQS